MGLDINFSSPMRQWTCRSIFPERQTQSSDLSHVVKQRPSRPTSHSDLTPGVLCVVGSGHRKPRY